MLRGLAKLLPLLIHEIAEIIIDRLKERRERKELEKQIKNADEKH